MIYVFDSSFIGALIVPDKKSELLDKLYSRIQNEDEKLAPQLIWYEVGNIIKNLMSRKRYTFEEVLAFIPLLAAIGLTTDFESGADYTEKLLRLSHDYYLGYYDAAYLELASRKKAILCTMNENLQTAAEIHGVKVLKLVSPAASLNMAVKKRQEGIL